MYNTRQKTKTKEGAGFVKPQLVHQACGTLAQTGFKDKHNSKNTYLDMLELRYKKYNICSAENQFIRRILCQKSENAGSNLNPCTDNV